MVTVSYRIGIRRTCLKPIGKKTCGRVGVYFYIVLQVQVTTKYTAQVSIHLTQGVQKVRDRIKLNKRRQAKGKGALK